jgi:predicted metal-dependent HD superfamily phosphohydrolase
MDMHARWLAFAGAIGARGGFAETFADLDRRFREPGRFYHTWEHVADCLAGLDAEPGLSDRPEAVELALWFHDAVYDPRAEDNEARSALLLLGAAKRLGIGADLAEASAGLVLATAHLAGPGGANGSGSLADRDAAAIRDLDLAILGAPRARFDAYETAVRREYGFLSDSEWRAGRSHVLRAFLDRPQIYLTEAFHDRLETPARRNLAASLAGLA